MPISPSQSHGGQTTPLSAGGGKGTSAEGGAGHVSVKHDAPPRKYNFYQRLFLRHHSEAFADRAELAVRAALCLTAMAMPLIMPEGSFEAVDKLKAKGYFTRSTALLFLFVVDHTAGQTIANAASGLSGIALALLNTLLLQTLVPGGIAADAPWHQLALVGANGVVFSWLMLWLNFGMPAKIFALSSFVSHWMDVMNPNLACPPGQYCSRGDPKVLAGEFVAVAIACGVALLCNIVPTPSLATRRARTVVRQVTASLTRSWMDVAAHFCGTASPDYRQERLLGELQQIRASLEVLDVYILYSYNEFGWVRSVRNIRDFLARLRRSLSESSDRLLCTWNTCLQQGFSQEHNDLMGRLWPDVYRVLFEGSRLMIHCTEVACGGRVLEGDESPLRDASQRTRDAVATLTAHFKEQKAALGVRGVSEELLDEHHFTAQVCAFGRGAADLADELVGASRGGRALPPAETPPSLLDRVTLADRNHLSFVVRSFTVILAAFAAGYLGHSKMMQRYDAGTAVFAALMLRKSFGCSNAKNYGRLRGAVIGTLFGHFIYASAGWCSWWGYAASGCAIFFWAATSLFAHHDPSRVSGGMAFGLTHAGASAGLLSAYFAASGVMEQCTTEVYTVVDVFGKSYFMVINALAAIFLVFAVDSLLSPETAAQLATQAYCSTLKMMTERLAHLMDPRAIEVRPCSTELGVRLRKAEVLGRQAASEPRLWRNPWLTLLYGDAMQSAQHMRMNLCGMEHGCLEQGRSNGVKADKLRRIMGLPSFAAVKKVAVEQMEHVEELLDSALSQETGGVMRCLENPQLKRNFGSEFAHAMRAFVAEANRQPEVTQDRDTVSSLEFDMAAQVSTQLSCTFALVAEASALQSSVMMRAF